MVVHIVEDDDAVADALATALADFDHHPEVYPDGETFLAKAKLLASDWVIVDLGLPGISGSDIVLKLKTLARPPNIVAISGKSRAKLLPHLREMPDLTVIRKPLSIDTLMAAMA